MSQEYNYQEKVLHYEHTGLLELWQGIEAGKTPGWGAGKALEYLILRAFQLEGAEVCWPYQVALAGEMVEQIDGVVYADGLACLIECKDQAEPCNIEPIAKLRNQLLRRPGQSIGCLFSRKGFTEAAATLAGFLSPQTILLWSGPEIRYALERKSIRQALTMKYRWCIQQAQPVYDIRKDGSL